MNLYDETIELLKNTNAPTKILSDATGVTVRYIDYLKKGEMTDPGVKKIQRLHDAIVAFDSGQTLVPLEAVQ